MGVKNNLITAVIITKNEERNIGRCIDSLQDIADEVVVVDSGSTDNTEAICKAKGARFVYHEWEGYANQKNYANSLASHEWTLSIDADEALSDELKKELLDIKNQNSSIQALSAEPTAHHKHSNIQVYAFNRLNNYCGQWILHGGWYPDIKIRLWPTGLALWDGAVHEDLSFSHPVETATLKGKLLHFTYYSFDELASRQISYAKLAAQKAYEKGKHCSAIAPYIHPVWTFLRNYLLKGGFLDGAAGYTIAKMSAYYTFLKYKTLSIKQSNNQAI